MAATQASHTLGRRPLIVITANMTPAGRANTAPNMKPNRMEPGPPINQKRAPSGFIEYSSSQATGIPHMGPASVHRLTMPINLSQGFVIAAAKVGDDDALASLYPPK